MIPTFLPASRYGYGSAEFYYQILDGYDNASIPLETFVSDSQYMDYDQDFTLGSKFALKEMVVRAFPLRAPEQATWRT